ncbi:PQQ-like domain-containing protein [Promicromonospora umidemergens]|nr:PQQ-binding-like beta-propeller repeat protein [Promicromonospora umidemergens]MCP2284494.1 PQQ-like domain-containing protein [Promicromonospora umidemergens]
MARDPDQGGAFVFDLVDDDTADLEGPLARFGTAAGSDPDGAETDTGGPATSAELGRRARAFAPVAAVLAIVLGTGFAVDGLRDDRRMERMRDAPGGVVDVSSPLEETWAWDGTVGSPQATAQGRGNDVALLGDLLAFQSGRELIALDPATGDEAWVIPLGSFPDCGPTGAAGWDEVTTPTLVCLAGPPEAREAMVIGPDGVLAGGRPLDAADERRYGHARPGPDGLVLRAKRVGPEPAEGSGDVECTESWECTGTVESGRDLEVRAEDAVTGEERWTATVPFRPTPADQCNSWAGMPWDSTDSTTDLDEMIDADSFGAQFTGGLVQLHGCGVTAGLTSGGEVLGLEIEPGAGGVLSLRAGGYVEYEYDDDGVRTTLYAADGGVVDEVDGYVSEPGAVDGPESTLLLAFGGEESRLRAYRTDGTTLWDAPVLDGAQVVIAQVAGSAIVASWSGAVYGLDLANGEERWTWNATDPNDEGPGDLFVTRGFTDGRSVLLVTHDGAGATGLVALDALSGELLWERPGSTDPGDAAFMNGMVAVDGNLLEITSHGVRGLG